MATIGIDGSDLEAVFIRAPIIRRVGPNVRVPAEEGRHLVATFHPELTRDTRVQRMFLAKLS